MQQLVSRADAEGYATLTLNRPDKLNALNVELFKELEAHLLALERETNSIGLVVIRGAGRCFSAGHDLADLVAGEQIPRPQFQASIIEKLSQLPQPVIAAVHSHCYTGALELVLGADIIFAAESAKFADTHAKWSLAPIWGLSQRLPRRVGSHRAKELMFTCRTVSGREAFEMGLAEYCVSDADFERQLTGLCASILANSWHSNQGNKRLVNDTDGLTLREGLAHEIYRNPGFGSDFATRIAAFKKKP